jgi:hypothetical protein
VVDLGVAEFLCRPEQAVSSVAHDHVDPTDPGEGTVDDLMDGLSVGHVEYLSAELPRLTIGQVGDRARVAYGADDLVTSPSSCSASSSPKPLLTSVMSQVRLTGPREPILLV